MSTTTLKWKGYNINQDTTHRLVTDEQIEKWNNGNYIYLTADNWYNYAEKEIFYTDATKSVEQEIPNLDTLLPGNYIIKIPFDAFDSSEASTSNDYMGNMVICNNLYKAILFKISTYYSWYSDTLIRYCSFRVSEMEIPLIKIIVSNDFDGSYMKNIIWNRNHDTFISEDVVCTIRTQKYFIEPDYQFNMIATNGLSFEKSIYHLDGDYLKDGDTSPTHIDIYYCDPTTVQDGINIINRAANSMVIVDDSLFVKCGGHDEDGKWGLTYVPFAIDENNVYNYSQGILMLSDMYIAGPTGDRFFYYDDIDTAPYRNDLAYKNFNGIIYGYSHIEPKRSGSFITPPGNDDNDDPNIYYFGIRGIRITSDNIVFKHLHCEMGDEESYIQIHSDYRRNYAQVMHNASLLFDNTDGFNVPAGDSYFYGYGINKDGIYHEYYDRDTYTSIRSNIFKWNKDVYITPSYRTIDGSTNTATDTNIDTLYEGDAEFTIIGPKYTNVSGELVYLTKATGIFVGKQKEVKFNQNTYKIQWLQDMSDLLIYFRNNYNGTWSEWNRIPSENISTAVPAE